MGCGCSAGGGSSSTQQSAQLKSQQFSQEPCEYTPSMVQQWLDKVNCFKDNGLYITTPVVTKRQLNSYIGILLSAQNKNGNICYFKNQLAEIEAFIIIVTSTGQC